MNNKEKLITILPSNPSLEEVVLHKDYLGMIQSANNGALLDYLFGKEEKNYGKLSEILKHIFTSEKPQDDDKEGTFFSDERKIGHNLCIIFTNKDFKEKKLQKLLNPESGFIDELKKFVHSNQEDSVTNSRFVQIFRSIITTNNDFISENKWILSPLLAFPDRIGYSSLIYTILRLKPEFYDFTTKRCYDFMRAGQKNNNKQFMKDSFILINVFSLLIKSTGFQVNSFTVEMMKNILDATLIGQKVYKLAFYEGIYVTSAILKQVESKSAISRYVKARGKAFYASLGLDTLEIEPDMDINNPNMKDIIAAFPAFYRSGFKKLYKLMFRSTSVVSSDFGRVCLDFITQMPEAKFISFIDDNDIPKLIMDYFPKLPNDPEVLEDEVNTQYLNPHVILLAFYIIEGLPAKRQTGQNKIIKNEFCPEKVQNEDFVNFVVQKLLPFRQLALPDLSFYHLDTTMKLNGA